MRSRQVNSHKSSAHAIELITKAWNAVNERHLFGTLFAHLLFSFKVHIDETPPGGHIGGTPGGAVTMSSIVSTRPRGHRLSLKYE